MNPFDEGPPGPNFVGREEELARVDDALDATATGGSSGLLVVGLHGTGKSSLLEECASRSQDHRLLAVGCSARNVTAHQQLRTLLEEAVNELDGRAGERTLLGDQWRGKVPDERLKEPLFQFHEADFMNTAALRHDLSLIIKRNNELGFAGIIFALDEAQEADPAVLAEMRQIGRRFTHLLFAVAVRVEAAPRGPQQAGEDWLRRTIARPAADPGVERFFPRIVPLGPFDEDEAKQCIRRRLDSAGDRIDFSRNLITAICSLGDRIPREIIRLSRNVYNACQSSRIDRADVSMLESAYKREYASVIAEATQQLNSLGESHQRVLRELAATPGPVTAEDMARRRHSSFWSEDARQDDADNAITATAASMKTIARSFDTVRETEDGRYTIDSELSRAAIRIALQMSAL